MAKKLSDISSLVDNAGGDFKIHLQTLLNPRTYDLLLKLSQLTDLYIFSGIIRNYFLKTPGFRDIDLVLKDEIDIESIFVNCKIIHNSFGGYKIFFGDVIIDLWYMNNTWAIRQQKQISYELDRYIPSTAFFNFSAIIYSFNEGRFYASHKFFQFLRDKKIDVVYEPNANLPLCVVNTIYYEDKLKMKVSKRMKRRILLIYKAAHWEYDSVQRKHFGSILYTSEDIRHRISSYSADLQSNTRKERIKGTLLATAEKTIDHR